MKHFSLSHVWLKHQLQEKLVICLKSYNYLCDLMAIMKNVNPMAIAKPTSRPAQSTAAKVTSQITFERERERTCRVKRCTMTCNSAPAFANCRQNKKARNGNTCQGLLAHLFKPSPGSSHKQGSWTTVQISSLFNSFSYEEKPHPIGGLSLHEKSCTRVDRGMWPHGQPDSFLLRGYGKQRQ